MSYPSQPSYTPPYGQPPTPPRQNNLWLVGSAVIAVLVIIMTVTLLIVQRSNDSTEGGGGNDPTTTAEEPTSGDPTTEEEPTEDEPTGDSENSGFVDTTCDTYDLTQFEGLMGEPIDADATDATATSYGDGTGSVSCTYYLPDTFWELEIYVSVSDDPEYTMDYVQENMDYWSELSSYTVTEYTELGDLGYMYEYGDESYQKININVAVQNIELQVSTWIDHSVHDPEAAVTMLEDAMNQAYLTFAGYEQ